MTTDDSATSRLFRTVTEDNNEDEVHALIDAGADVNITNNDGETALFYAVRRSNNESVVRALIDAGVDVNRTRSDGSTALFDAVQQSNNESVVHALIDAGADVNITNDGGETALFCVVQESNNESVVHALIDAGVDVNISNNVGETALFCAVEKSNNESVVRALIDAGAFINARDIYGRTPLFYALYDPETVHTLLDKGGKQGLFLKDNCNCSILAYFVETNEFGLLDKIFDSPLSLPGSLDLLCEQGLNKASIVQTIINIVMSKFPLTIPGPGRYDWRHLKIIPSMPRPFTAEKFINALKLASSYVDENYSHQKINLVELFENKIGNPEKISEALRLLIELGADPNSVDSHGNTALHYTTHLAWMGVPQETVMEMCHQLEKLGVKFNLRNHENQTALLFSLSGDLRKVKGGPLLAVKTLVDVCEFLSKHGSSIKERSLNGNSVFHFILQLFHQALALTDKIERQKVIQEMNRLLQLFPAEKVARSRIINIPDNHLNTPLHLWASLALPSPQDYTISVNEDQKFEQVLQVVFKYLLRCGAQLNARNSDDETPLHLCNTWSAVKLLINEGGNPNNVDLLGRSPLLAAAKRIESIKNPVAFYPDISKSEDHKKFWETAIEKGLDPWTADKDGKTVLGILLKCDFFLLAKALVDVACDKNYTQSEPFTICLLNAICKDKSTRTSWKSNLVQDILKSRKVPTNLSEALRLCCENVRETGVFGEVSECEGVYIFATSHSQGDESFDDELSVPIKKVKIDHSLFERSVHCEIIKILRSHGADGKSCLELTENCPQLQDLIMKPLDNDTIPVLIPWTSVSKRYLKNLAKVARRQECNVVQDVFWHYKDHIASGSFGYVFVGINEKDGREVAIKRIEKLRMQRPEDKREITNLTALADCEQVVRYLHFFEDEKFAYIILELMEGDLDEYLHGSTFDAGKSTQLCEDVVKGLKYLHEHNIIHRDLKPGNILYKIHPELCLKIADFGLSLCVTNSATTVYGTNAGTRCWIAPEVLKSKKKDHSKSSDLFSCGLLLHYILSPKKHPFSPVDCASKGEYQIDNETEANIMDDNVEGWDECVSPEATHLIRNMLESNKINRPTAQEALDHPLFWSSAKKIDFLIAVGNQPMFEYSRKGKAICLTPVEADLEKNVSTIVMHGMWNDPRYKHMPVIYTEMNRRNYDTHSVVELVRFIRNAHAHVSEGTRPTPIRKMILEDFIFLEYFPSLVMEVYKVVITHGWDQKKEEIKYAMNKYM